MADVEGTEILQIYAIFRSIPCTKLDNKLYTQTDWSRLKLYGHFDTSS